VEGRGEIQSAVPATRSRFMRTTAPKPAGVSLSEVAERHVDRNRFSAKAYLKDGCPFSFKYLLFMAEAKLLDRIEIVRCNPQSAGFEAIKAKLTAATHRPATFPTVEVEPGRYQSDSDQLIEYYARTNNVVSKNLTALSFYKESIFPELEELHAKQERGGSSTTARRVPRT